MPATLSEFSGELVAKGSVEQLFGQFDHAIQVIIKFPTRELASSWYHSPVYQALTQLRNEAIDSQFQLIG